MAVKLRGYGWAGYRMGDSSLHYWGATTAKPARKQQANILLDCYLKRETYVNCTLRGEKEMDDAVAQIRATKPNAIVCEHAGRCGPRTAHQPEGPEDLGNHPGALRCREALAGGLRGPREGVRAGGVETYGCREVMLIGTECERHDGLHQSMENMYRSICRDGGRPRAAARPGEVGEIVITDLHNFGMPFIRYANGDLATQGDGRSAGAGEACSAWGPSRDASRRRSATARARG